VAYDPFARGRHPVGVRTVELRDDARDRRVPLEVWYPAAENHRGADLDEQANDSFQVMPALPPARQLAVRDAVPRSGETSPLVVFSHGFGAHRRVSTFLCTHLSSHGYVVAAPDHVGNTLLDFFQAVAGGGGARGPGYLEQVMSDRTADLLRATDALLAGELPGLEVALRPDRVALVGYSFGGWAALAATPRDPRAAVIVALAPVGGDGTRFGSRAREALDLEWERLVPTLVIAAGRDSVLPLAGIRGLYDAIKAPKKLIVLEEADHLHFADDAARAHEMFRAIPKNDFVPLAAPMAPFAELCPQEPAHDAIRGLSLAHIDAFLVSSDSAKYFLSDHLPSLLWGRGVAAAAP
jgi:predicted dienelactone hydrolase